MLRFAFSLATLTVFASVALLSSGSNARAEDPEVTFKPTFAGTTCPVALPAGVRDGVEVRCGYVTVPERHARPEGKTIQLAVAVVQAGGERTVADPIVILDGGPGVSSMSLTLPFVAGPMGAPLRDAGRDIVLIEQRGNYHSKPALTCPEVFGVLSKAIETDQNVEQRRGGVVTAYAACRERHKGLGVDLSAYNSVENAADIPMVVQALKYDRYNVYGVSYGTQLAQHLLRDHPQGIRSVVLNSVMPMDANVNAAVPGSAERAFQLLFELCRKDTACTSAYPRLEAEFDAIVAQLNTAPRKVGARMFTGDDVVRLLSEEFGDLADMPRKIAAISHGDTSWLASKAGGSGAAGTESLGLLYSTICAEDADFTRNDMLLETQIERAMAAGLPSDILAICAGAWNVDKLPKLVDYAVLSDVPAVLMTGEFDVITPPTFLPLVGAGMSKSYQFRFPTGGHADIDPCKLTMMLAFIEDPSKAPNSACIGTSSVRFNTAGPGISTLPDGLNQAVPPAPPAP